MMKKFSTVILLILLLTVLALRIAEASGRISLDSVRETIGGSVPFIETIFPDPNGSAE